MVNVEDHAVHRRMAREIITIIIVIIIIIIIIIGNTFTFGVAGRTRVRISPYYTSGTLIL